MYALIDDGWHDHPKVLHVLADQDHGYEAITLWALALSWARKPSNMANPQRLGVIPPAMLGRLLGRQPSAEAVRLLTTPPPGFSNALWSECEAGYTIHEFRHWQHIDKQQAKTQQARAAAAARWTPDTLFDQPEDAGAYADADAGAYAGAVRMQGDTNTNTNTNTKELPSALRARPMAYPAAFDAFWAAYPRHVAKRKTYDKWRAAVRRATPSMILAGAKRYAADPNREDEFTAHPSTWLNQDRWLDGPLPQRSRVNGSPQDRMQAGLALAARLHEQEERAGQ